MFFAAIAAGALPAVGFSAARGFCCVGWGGVVAFDEVSEFSDGLTIEPAHNITAGGRGRGGVGRGIAVEARQHERAVLIQTVV